MIKFGNLVVFWLCGFLGFELVFVSGYLWGSLLEGVCCVVSFELALIVPLTLCFGEFVFWTICFVCF